MDIRFLLMSLDLFEVRPSDWSLFFTGYIFTGILQYFYGLYFIYIQSDWPLFRLNTPQLLLYLFSLCFQWLQVVGDIFQLFLKVTWFTDQCKKDEKQKKRK